MHPNSSSLKVGYKWGEKIKLRNWQIDLNWEALNERKETLLRITYAIHPLSSGQRSSSTAKSPHLSAWEVLIMATKKIISMEIKSWNFILSERLHEEWFRKIQKFWSKQAGWLVEGKTFVSGSGAEKVALFIRNPFGNEAFKTIHLVELLTEMPSQRREFIWEPTY